MVSGHFQFTQQIDQFKDLQQHHIFGMIDADQRMQPNKLRRYIILVERKETIGIKRREFALNEGGFTGKIMGERIISAIDQLFSTWKPREKYEFINIDEVKEDELNHELFY
jgi:hypothetical protein